MPNICEYTMRLKGKVKDVRKFLEWLGATYCYCRYDENGSTVLDPPEIYTGEDGKKKVTEHHIGYRTFDCFYDEHAFSGVTDDETVSVEADGSVAWSLEVCWFDRSSFSYFNKQSEIQKRYALTLPDACRLLSVSAEVFSNECGMEFSEHFIVDESGKVLCDEYADYYEIDISEYDSYEDIGDDETRECLTEEDFNEAKKSGEEYIRCCEYLDEYGGWKFALQKDL